MWAYYTRMQEKLQGVARFSPAKGIALAKPSRACYTKRIGILLVFPRKGGDILIVPLLVLLLAASGAALLLLPRARQRRLKADLTRRWGDPAALKRLEDDLLEDAAGYFRARAKALPARDFVDDVTWADLDMDEVFRRIDSTQSAVGSEVLYAMLRETGLPEHALSRRARRIARLQSDERARLAVQRALSAAGTRRFHGAIRYLFGSGFAMPPHAGLYLLLGLLPIAWVLAGLLYTPLFFGLAFSFALNLVVYYRTELRWKSEVCAVRHVASLLECARRLTKSRPDGFEAEVDEIAALAAPLKGLRRLCSVLAMEAPGAIDFLTDYVKILFLSDMICLCAIVRQMEKHADELRRLYALIGELDACAALAALRETSPTWCEPVFHESLEVSAQGLVHPLVSNAVPNKVVWRGGVVVTGSNASGKSTFAKAVAVNAILAQTTFTCFARAFSLCRGRVMTSMAARDSLARGESTFVAELRSLWRLLDAREGVVLCFLDEILRGTNTAERIAASAAVLQALNAGKRLVMAATHDAELTRMPGFDNWHFEERIEAGGVTFPYRLLPGPAKGHTAIALMRQLGFDEAIVRRAEQNVKEQSDGEAQDAARAEDHEKPGA